MLTKRYLPSTKNLSAILEKIISGTAPSKFTIAHLKNIGFPSSQDRAIIPVLKDLGFLTADGTPTRRYHEYRNSANAKKVLGEAMKEAYEELFHVNAKPTRTDRSAIEGTFKSVNNVSDRVAELQAMTFFGLLQHADVTGEASIPSKAKKTTEEEPEEQVESREQKPATKASGRSLELRHNIEVHLPATKDIEVYNAIFKALKEHLLD